MDACLQDVGGAGPPKWEPRSWLGIYVGHSPIHAGSVALVLNPQTGLISPQFHVVFDDDFSTVPHLRAGTVPPNWAQLVESSSYKCVDGFYDVTKTWFEGTSDESSDEQSYSHAAPGSTSDVGTLPDMDVPHTHTGESLGVDSQIHNPSSVGPLPYEGGPDSLPQMDESMPTLPIVSPDESHSPDHDFISFDSDSSSMPPIVDFSTAGLRRSKRTKKQPNRFTFGSFFTKICAIGVVFVLVYPTGLQALTFLISLPKIWLLLRSSIFMQQTNALMIP